MIKKAMPYMIALIVGIVLMFLIMPMAKAGRTNPSLIGGEVLIPVMAIVITGIWKNRAKIAESLNLEEDDDE